MKNWGIKKDAVILKRLSIMVYKADKNFIRITLIRAIVKTMIPLMNVIIPARLIDEMIGEARWEVLLVYAAILSAGNFGFGCLKSMLDRKWILANKHLQNSMEVMLGSHIMDMNYEKIEDPAVLDLKERALYPIKMQNSLNELIEKICSLVSVVFTLISLIVILLQANVLCFMGILFLCGIQFFIIGKVQQNLHIFYEKIPVTMRRSVYYENIAADYKPLKEIQIYKAKDMLLHKLKKAHQDNVDLFRTSFSKNGKYEGAMGIITQVQLVFVYACNVINLFLDKISLGDFILVINAASKFSENILMIAKDWAIIRQDCRYLDVYLQFMDISPEKEMGEEHIPNDQIFEIEFRNVSFRYPNQKEMVLENVSVTIHPGERISIVGMNGAGKTTFVKLLCRLLIPTEGGIYLNGININRYCVEEYRNLISSVFQDFKIFSFSIEDNIDINRSGGNVGEAIRRAGLERWVKGCIAGEKTQVTKRFYEEGVEPSGGEAQKIAIARAIFKDSPIMVLDEPTAALDPYAEYEIYRSFDDISKGKTVIYISHRLGYCLLSDRILVFEKGKIVEQGTHEKLKREGGIYTKMWNAQAKYYTD